jgi:hypothetical protein
VVGKITTEFMREGYNGGDKTTSYTELSGQSFSSKKVIESERCVGERNSLKSDVKEGRGFSPRHHKGTNYYRQGSRVKNKKKKKKKEKILFNS